MILRSLIFSSAMSKLLLIPSSIFSTSDVAFFINRNLITSYIFFYFSHWVYVFLYLLQHEEYINIHWSKALFNQLYHLGLSLLTDFSPGYGS